MDFVNQDNKVPIYSLINYNPVFYSYYDTACNYCYCYSDASACEYLTAVGHDLHIR